jgi:hypothetical protein
MSKRRIENVWISRLGMSFTLGSLTIFHEKIYDGAVFPMIYTIMLAGEIEVGLITFTTAEN